MPNKMQITSTDETGEGLDVRTKKHMAETNHPDEPMSQAEVGGGARVDPEQRLQRPGYLIRDLTLASMQGDPVQISNYGGRANLVLVFAGQSPLFADRFLRGLTGQQEAFVEQEAVVILITACPDQNARWGGSPFPVLVDSDGRIHATYGAVDQHGRLVPVMYVTDRFGEIAAVYPGFDGKELPSTEQVVKLLEFLNHQCPECEPSEWPR